MSVIYAVRFQYGAYVIHKNANVHTEQFHGTHTGRVREYYVCVASLPFLKCESGVLAQRWLLSYVFTAEESPMLGPPTAPP